MLTVTLLKLILIMVRQNLAQVHVQPAAEVVQVRGTDVQAHPGTSHNQR